MSFNIESWGARVGLSYETVDVLMSEDITTEESLVSLNDSDIRELNISIGQRALLRKAINAIKGIKDEEEADTGIATPASQPANGLTRRSEEVADLPSSQSRETSGTPQSKRSSNGTKKSPSRSTSRDRKEPRPGTLAHGLHNSNTGSPNQPAPRIGRDHIRARVAVAEQEEDDDEAPELIGKNRRSVKKRGRLSSKKDSLTEEEKGDSDTVQPVVLDLMALNAEVSQEVKVMSVTDGQVDEKNTFTVEEKAVPEIALPPPQKLPPDLPPWRPGQTGPFQWDNLPTAPPPDDPNAMPPQCPPPPMEGMPAFSGYENTAGFGQMAPLAPPPPLPPPTGEAPPMEFDNVANLSEKQCREAMLGFVGEHCCYGKGCAENMEMTQIQPSTALHYILETFTEGRSTGFVHEPYRGGPVDGPENGMAPAPWTVPCEPDMPFKDQTKKAVVPHTTTVKPCHMCQARGFNRCHRCHGVGWVRCMTCNGDGRVTKHDPEKGHYQAPCHNCGADGKRSCGTCEGDGRVTCTECYGYRNLRCFIQLTTTFTNHKSDHIMEKTDMPDKLIRHVHGVKIFEQTMLQVWPITCYPIREINENSVRLTNQHRSAYPTERYMQQRQTLRAVPVTEVEYKWKNTRRRFWVYGHERKVYCPDYPQTCCWGCIIS